MAVYPGRGNNRRHPVACGEPVANGAGIPRRRIGGHSISPFETEYRIGCAEKNASLPHGIARLVSDQTELPWRRLYRADTSVWPSRHRHRFVHARAVLGSACLVEPSHPRGLFRFRCHEKVLRNWRWQSPRIVPSRNGVVGRQGRAEGTSRNCWSAWTSEDPGNSAPETATIRFHSVMQGFEARLAMIEPDTRGRRSMRRTIAHEARR